jgi:hypothetical protein
MVKNAFSLFHWNCPGVIFLVGQHVVVVVRYIIAGKAFFFATFLSHSLKSVQNFRVVIIVIDILTWVLILLIFNFCFFILFVKVLFDFNFIL